MVNNLLDRNFNSNKKLEVVVSDLTYVRVGEEWNYICILVELFNREIIGNGSSENKDALLVETTFLSSGVNLSEIGMFHTDRGSEFKNSKIDELLEINDITRSLSEAGSPYDNAVAEATFKIFKTEFIKDKVFENMEKLQLELFDYVNWFNNFRIHGSLGYLTPVAYANASQN